MASETAARAGSPNALDRKGLERELEPCSFPQKSTDKPGGGELCLSPRRLMCALGWKGDLVQLCHDPVPHCLDEAT